MSVDFSAFASARPSINAAKVVYDSALHGGEVGVHNCAGSPVPAGATVLGYLSITSDDWAPAATAQASLTLDGAQVAASSSGTAPATELIWTGGGPAVLTPDDSLPYVEVTGAAITAGVCTFYLFYML